MHCRLIQIEEHCNGTKFKKKKRNRKEVYENALKQLSN